MGVIVDLRTELHSMECGNGSSTHYLDRIQCPRHAMRVPGRPIQNEVVNVSLFVYVTDFNRRLRFYFVL